MKDETINTIFVIAAAFASLRSILLVELLGLEKLTNAFGLLLLFQGIAGIFGSPLAGKSIYPSFFQLISSQLNFKAEICLP